MSEQHRIGCESCGSRTGCECNALRECENCGDVFLPRAQDEDELLCAECEEAMEWEEP